MAVSEAYFGLTGFAFPTVTSGSGGQGAGSVTTTDLDHSPADVIRYLLIAMGAGIHPDDLVVNSGTQWPIYAGGEPNVPDETITVYDTAGRDDGRMQYDGERTEHPGIQIRIRARDHQTGYVKARQLAVSLDKEIYQNTVSIGNSQYFIHAVSRSGNVIPLGKESPTSKRSLFTINATVTIRMIVEDE